MAIDYYYTSLGCKPLYDVGLEVAFRLGLPSWIWNP